MQSILTGPGHQYAHFLTPELIAWPAHTDSDPARSPAERVDPAERLEHFELWHSPTGGLAHDDAGRVHGGELLAPLTPRSTPLTSEEIPDRRHLAAHRALTLPPLDRDTLTAALTGQLAVIRRSGERLLETSGLQIPGVLDALYAADTAATDTAATTGAAHATLGPRRLPDGTWEVSVWAPTAKTVTLLLEDAPQPMRREKSTGIWRTTGPATWTDARYLFDVEVYVPAEGRVVTNRVTDPYSVSLTVDSEHSVLVDLEDPRWAPAIWADTPAPRCERPAQQTIYELHVRDFSGGDDALPSGFRGTYAAFAHPDSRGAAHLRDLAQAGLTTVHLLPTYDIATIPERRSEQVIPAIPDAGPASTQQQAAVLAVKDRDPYNWGYDPFHYLAPEGSYAREGHQDGGARIAEFRTMVGALHAMGLQVVLDVVFNHTAYDGQHPRSVLDRIVPGYYHRLDLDGTVESSTCTSNTASEHAMMHRLLVDGVTLWARAHRVDGFRFDLMGHHRRADLEAVREALAGTGAYVYGEGWDFGEVQGGARFHQAIQGNLDGTSIGSFNDRIRDAVHGGSLMDPDVRMHRGFATGLFHTPNPADPRTTEEQRAALLHATDLIRLSLAGNLKGYRLLTSTGQVLRGEELLYGTAPAAFGSRPEETVNYVDAHDNETLFDTFVGKLAQDTPIAERIRRNTLALATVALGQSPAFWAAGTDLLRSKSLDTDSYDSGDRVNLIDWTMQDNGFGRGLPSAERNEHLWERQAPMLENPSSRPTPEHIAHAAAMARDLLRLRHSSELFTLGDAELIRQKVTFPGAGPEATPGLLVMRVDDTVGEDTDPALDGLVTVFNASDEPITEQIEGMAGLEYTLHPVQAEGADPVVKESTWDTASGTVTIPAHTVAVFIAKQAQDTGPGEPEDPEQPGQPEQPGDPAPSDPAPSDPAPSGPTDPTEPAPDSSAQGPLARTGIEAWALALAAAILLLGGATVTAGRRR
ncbi:pullulanase-type alpha-1,6-glucosidase [Brachybacterium sp. Marseille-Q7125]|uniref:pullulanase-type alpha-1,6-glucosidase n=1 Tax=Brachybacterium sp. Marseille-Q7125 TaxID=2932815 RepID=UPI001FF314D1|nr:pullulanase-type alpha-1,6-glucosidase [Brachybacterium sp. Marseille-Q7125]